MTEYNQVIFGARNTPVNANILLIVTLEGVYDREEAKDMAENVLRSWGIGTGNFEFLCAEFKDIWGD